MNASHKPNLFSLRSSSSYILTRKHRAVNRTRRLLISLVEPTPATVKFEGLKKPLTLVTLSESPVQLQEEPVQQKKEHERQFGKLSNHEDSRHPNILKLKITRAQSDFLSQRSNSKMMEEIMPNFSVLQFMPQNKMQVGKEKLLRLNFVTRSKSDDPTDLLFRTVSKASSAFQFQAPQLLIESVSVQKKKLEPKPQNRSQRCKRGLEYIFRYISSFMIISKAKRADKQRVKEKSFDCNGSIIISEIDSDDQFSIIQEIQSKQTHEFSNNFFSHLNDMLEEEIEDASKEFPSFSITINGEEESKDQFLFKGRIKSNSVYVGTRACDFGGGGQDLSKVEYGIGLTRNKSSTFKQVDWRKWYE